MSAAGVNIIAAFSGAVSPTGEAFDNRTVPFITMSVAWSEKQFEVTMIGVVPKNQVVDGVLIWTDGKHFVRSPILVSSGFF